MSLYEHRPHPRLLHHREHGAAKTADQHPAGGAFSRFNTRLGLQITTLVGTMVCAYIFLAISLISLPSAISTGNLTIMVAWLSSSCVQLVLLPVIIVGQNAQAKAADARSEQTYKDAEALLQETAKLQEHLTAQDGVLSGLLMLAHPGAPHSSRD